MKKLFKIAAVVGLGASMAFADATLTAPTFDLSNVVTVAGALLTGLAGIWAIKKALHLIR